jgi:hypothetical protein
MGVDVAADLLDLGAELDDTVDQLHGDTLVWNVDATEGRSDAPACLRTRGRQALESFALARTRS